MSRHAEQLISQSLNSESQLPSANELEQIVRRCMPAWHACRFSGFEFMPGGYSNLNFRFIRHADDEAASFILRQPPLAAKQVDRVFERNWYAALPDRVTVKPVYFNVQTGVMITEFVDAPLLVDVFSDCFNSRDLVHYIKKLHSQLPTTERRFDPLAQAKHFVDEAPIALPTGLRMDATQSLHRTCHNDLNPWNVLVAEGGWLTIDWEQVGQNDPIFDLVTLHQGLFCPPDELNEVAKLFLPNCDDARLVTAYRAFWLREWAWAKQQLVLGNERSEIAEQVEVAYERLQALRD